MTVYSPCGSEIVESIGVDGDPGCDIFVSRSTRADHDSSSTISSTGQIGAKSPAVTTSLIIRRASFLFSRGLGALFCTCRLRLTGTPGRRGGIEMEQRPQPGCGKCCTAQRVFVSSTGGCRSLQTPQHRSELSTGRQVP